MEIHRHPSTIARELNRNSCDNGYIADTAELFHQERMAAPGTRCKCTKVIKTLIEAKLDVTWSPEQIAHTVMKGQVCFKTIYRWLYDGKLMNGEIYSLRQKGKRHKAAEKRGVFVHSTPISERPQGAKDRSEFGHWELDSMVSSRGKSKGCFSTFAERKTRLYVAYCGADRTADAMKSAITRLYTTLPKGAFKTATTDRGKEFACYEAVKEDLDLTLYFADAYAPWQRGTNENSNGLLREFFPKKTNLAKITQEELAKCLWLINNRPRKCLGWKSPIQVFLYEVSHLT
jgi:IS30 family transposase